ncbi:ankyrin repeat domain-containing protein [Wolbachia endosymbiont of Cylisticus convexus]|nr:ankyrin repeat domain-containing protein [Wolbachia endosymbiont of Cylisticus convexus]RDD34431.1 ankyrin repeat domain-containing protein [Wolbachia endosymbiont of Cylisticus convexus]
MAHERLSEILSIISDLNESNIIERVKEKLEKEDPGTYEEWQDNGFDINYTFDDQSTFLHIAARGNLVKMAELLIKKGLMLIQQTRRGVLLCIVLLSMDIKR